LINGNLKGKTITVSQAVASGIFTRDEVFLYKVSNTFPISYSNRDDYFNYVTILLSGDANTFVRDASNNSFNITVNGDTRLSAFTPYGISWSNFFDGNDTLTTPSNTAFTYGTSDFTIEGWVYLTAGVGGGGYSYLFGQGASSGSTATLGLYIQDGVFKVWNGSAVIVGSVSFTLNSWTHFAISRSGTTLRLFINGVLSGSATNSSNITTGSTTGVSIGRWSEISDTNYIAGYVSNFRVVKGSAVYTSAFTPPTSPLTAISNTVLLTCQSNRLIDNSTNAFTITKNGDVAISAFGPFTETDVTTGSGYFDGTGDYLTIQGNSNFVFGTGNFTLEAWIYPTASQAQYAAILANYATDGWFLAYSTSNIIQFSNFNVVALASSTAVPLNAWTHIAVARNGTSLKMFFNGVEVASNTSSTTYGIANTTYVGFNGTSHYINGYIADTRATKGTALYTTTFTPPTSSLTAEANTQLLTLQNRIGHNNHQFVNEGEPKYLITRTGNVTQGSFSPFSQTGWSNYFDGTGDYLNVSYLASNFGTGDFTVEVYVYLTRFDNDGNTILDTRSGATANPFFFGITSAGLVYYYTGTVYSSSTAVPLNTWVHLAICRSGTTLKIFQNGVETLSRTDSSNLTGTSTGSVTIGRAVQGIAHINGYLSNLRIVKGTAYYTTAFTPPTEPLTAISGTSLLTCQSNRFVDNSTNAFTITRNGDSSVQAFSPFGTNTPYLESTVGGSAYFDGTADNLSIAGSTALATTGDLTLEAWAYLNSASNYAGIFSMRNSTNADGLAINILNTGYIDFSLDGSSPGEYTGTLVPLKQWFHIALVRSGSSTNNVSCYLNGTRVGQFTSNFTSNGASNVAIIGRYYADGANQYNLNGFISSLRYVVGSALYSGTTLTVPTAPLTDIKGTQVLLNFNKMGILNSTSKNSFETAGDARIITSTKKFGTGSMYFDGTGDYLTTYTNPDHSFGTGNFTIECWVYRLDTPARGVVQISSTAGGLSTSDLGLAIGSDTGSVWRIYCNGTGYNSTVTYSTNTWYHVALVRNSGTTRLYVDGTSVISQSDTTNYTGGNICIGGFYSTSFLMYGYIDDFRVTRGIARYTATFIPPPIAHPTASATS